MRAFARFSDGVEVSREVFETLLKFAPDGFMDVLACDQDNSVRKMLIKFFISARVKGKSYPLKVEDSHVVRINRIFARALASIPAAALFNRFGYMSPGFRELVGSKTMLIGRLEASQFGLTPDGKAHLARLDVDLERAAEKVDAFKTLVKLDPWHREAWQRNLEWLQDIWEKSQRLNKPLFNETLYSPVGISEIEKVARLPEALIKMAEDFGSYGHFYKTQVPILWVGEERISSSDETREVVRKMKELVPRPILVLSAAVDFSQYACQFALVCDLVAGPMCGRAYFKDPFSDTEVVTWRQLEKAIEQVAVPRMKIIQDQTRAKSEYWWDKMELSNEAEKLISSYSGN